MQEMQLKDIALKLKKFHCEFQTVEVKSASEGCPKHLYDTLSSFSNQTSGGVILFGIDESAGFEVVGVYDAQDLQHRVAEQCKEMSPEVRPLFTVVEIDGKTVVSAEIPGVDVTERPVFYKGRGRLGGAFVRVGEADEPMSEYEIYTYEAYRRRIRDDIRPVDGAVMEQLRDDLLCDYLRRVKADRANLAANASDSEILELMGIRKGTHPTISGILVFAKYPQAYFPQLCLTAVVVPGLKMGDVGDGGERFLANEKFTGRLDEILKGAVDFVVRNMRVKTVIGKDGRRDDKAEFPVPAVREAILNALVHRDYSLHTEGSPISVCMYSDRMEVTNKGGLYGRISVDLIGKVCPETRNPALVDMMEIMGYTENRYSGVPTMQREMQAFGLPPPEFVNRNGEFKVILRNRLGVVAGSFQSANVEDCGSIDLSDRERRLLEYCNVERTRAQVVDCLGVSHYYAFSKIVPRLVKAGLLRLSRPEAPRSRLQRFTAAPNCDARIATDAGGNFMVLQSNNK